MELQLNENKRTNAGEFAKLFHVSADCIAGKASEQDVASIARLAAISLMTTIQCALNKDLLLESEKGQLYCAFDTKKLLRGDLQSRFAAYKTALDANFMQIDKVRYADAGPGLDPAGASGCAVRPQNPGSIHPKHRHPAAAEQPGGRTCRRKRVAGSGRSGYTGRARPRLQAG